MQSATRLAFELFFMSMCILRSVFPICLTLLSSKFYIHFQTFQIPRMPNYQVMQNVIIDPGDSDRNVSVHEIMQHYLMLDRSWALLQYWPRAFHVFRGEPSNMFDLLIFLLQLA